MTEMRVRPMELPDAGFCVRVHMQAFQGFFLTFLGPEFLNQFYSAIACDPSGIGFVAEEEGRILGFVVGTSQPSGFYKRLLRRRLWSFGWASLGAFLKKPRILPRLLRAFTMPGQKACAPNCGTLMSIAVSPEAQSRGIGQRLARAFIAEATRRGLEHVNLTTDCLNNDSTNRFYQKLGFSFLHTYTTPEGRKMNEYLFTLQPAERGFERALPNTTPFPGTKDAVGQA